MRYWASASQVDEERGQHCSLALGLEHVLSTQSWTAPNVWADS